MFISNLTLHMIIRPFNEAKISGCSCSYLNWLKISNLSYSCQKPTPFLEMDWPSLAFCMWSISDKFGIDLRLLVTPNVFDFCLSWDFCPWLHYSDWFRRNFFHCEWILLIVGKSMPNIFYRLLYGMLILLVINNATFLPLDYVTFTTHNLTKVRHKKLILLFIVLDVDNQYFLFSCWQNCLNPLLFNFKKTSQHNSIFLRCVYLEMFKIFCLR